MPQARPQMVNGLNGAAPMSPSPLLQSPGQLAPQRPLTDTIPGGQPVLYLLSLNGTFERKTIQVPFYPETLRVGRQTNNKTVPTPLNGFFDSKVLSRQHAEIWADRQGKIWIRDVKSSNGTFVNGTRLSPENRESEPHELQSSDHLELGIDIVSEDQKSVVHHKVAAKVEHAGFLNPSNNLLDMNFGDLDPANGGMMMPQPGLPFRNRTTSQASAGTNGRMAGGAHMMNAQSAGVAFNNRTFMNNSFSTELIVKKLRVGLFRMAHLSTLQSLMLYRTRCEMHGSRPKICLVPASFWMRFCPTRTSKIRRNPNCQNLQSPQWLMETRTRSALMGRHGFRILQHPRHNSLSPRNLTSQDPKATCRP